jgi:hypothetical protein
VFFGIGTIQYIHFGGSYDHMGCIHKGMGFIKDIMWMLMGIYVNVDGEYYWQTLDLLVFSAPWMFHY